MTTYTIAYLKPNQSGDSMLLAVVPDCKDAVGEARFYLRTAYLDPDQEIITESGLILTDEEPDDLSRIRWSGQGLGFITDEAGNVFQYAINR